MSSLPSWPVDKPASLSVRPPSNPLPYPCPSSYQREWCHLNSPPSLSSEKYQTERDFVMFPLMCSFNCEKKAFNKITKVEAVLSPHILLFLFHLLFKVLPLVSPGPAFNLFLRLCDFKLGPFVVNKYTSPGVTASRSVISNLSFYKSLINTETIYRSSC